MKTNTLLAGAATLLGCLMASMVGTGCASPKSASAKPLTTTIAEGADLRKYEVATVVPFEVAPDQTIEASVGARFAEDLAARLRTDFVGLFQDVRLSAALEGKEAELVVSGRISTYKPSSRAARAIPIGLAPAKFAADMKVLDAASQGVLLSAPISKYWGWGGIMGASKGIDDMMAESAAAAASTIARAKGWRPPSGEQK